MRNKIFVSLLVNLLLVILFNNCSLQESSIVSELGWVNYTISIDENEKAPVIGEFSLEMSTSNNEYSHKWNNINDFSDYESFHIGEYNALAISGDMKAEGYNCQCYVAEKKFVIESSKRTEVHLEASLYQALISCEYTDDLLNAYKAVSLTFHTSGSGYIEYVDNYLMLPPGRTYLYVTLTDHKDRKVTVTPDFVWETKSNTLYNIKLDNEGDRLVISGNDKEASMAITDELFASPSPALKTNGFISNDTIDLTEGYPSYNPIAVEVESESGIQSIILTSLGLPEKYNSIPKECNLMENPLPLTNLGLQIDKISGKRVDVNFTKLLENINVDESSKLSFMLQARDIYGRVSDEAILNVNLESVTFSIIEKIPAYIGENIASILLSVNRTSIQIDDLKIYQTNDNNEPAKEIKIKSCEIDKDNKTLRLTFDVDNGISDVPIRLDFMGIPKVKTVINRNVPQYNLCTDVFATSAIITINADNDNISEDITRFCTIISNGKKASITERNPEKHKIVIGGLEPSTKYDIQAVVIEGRYSPTASIITESAAQIPDGDFENADVAIKYPNLPSGGIYSTSNIPIFNMQNFEKINAYWLRKHWASVNDKTFCRDASNHNTWYMQVSSISDYDNKVSGSKSVKLTSVGWSIDGEEIPPYKQEKDEYLPYNKNVPYVAHKAAGKLFIGSYSFNPQTMSESYFEGMKFTSRPSSLNGFYKYTPDEGSHNDAGLIEVEIYGNVDGTDILIGSASTQLFTSPDFIAFNIPITYHIYGVKANRLKLMFSSSCYKGSISEEDANVPVTAYIQSAMYKGSELWIDNISFSY